MTIDGVFYGMDDEDFTVYQIVAILHAQFREFRRIDLAGGVARADEGVCVKL